MSHARIVGCEPFVIRQIGLADEVEKVAVVVVRVGQQTYESVSRCIRSTCWRQEPFISERAFGWLKRSPSEMLDQIKAHHGFEHRHFDVLTVTSVVSVYQCRHDGLHDVKPSDFVCNDRRNICGMSVRGGEEASESRSSLDSVVIGRLILVRPAAPEAVSSAIDQGRIYRVDGSFIQTQTLQSSSAHIGNQNISGGNQVKDHLPSCRVLQVDT